ncbi:MAG: 50S ribosomal protein L9 [Prevotella sp.]|nr:50S ribosomal protein L9 [Candidatus Equicola faecalis]MDO4820075.1 50S ribosomal protein L9 [Prevotella sp.]
MEIILKEDIIGLGYKNDIVNVKSGYGRNYLIPQGKGIFASPAEKKILAENLRQQARKIEAIKAEAQKKGDALQGASVEIAVKVSANGVAYGSVGPAQVCEALKEKGFDIDRKIITMKEVKKVGDFVALVHYHKEVVIEIPVKVIAENAEELAAEARARKAELQAKKDAEKQATNTEAEETADEKEVLEEMGVKED